MFIAAATPVECLQSENAAQGEKLAGITWITLPIRWPAGGQLERRDTHPGLLCCTVQR